MAAEPHTTPTPANSPSTFSPLLCAALQYADLGYLVFPCIPGTKRPLTPHGLNDASSDPGQIEHWWTEQPDANIAIRTDGLLVIDLDSDDRAWLGDQDARWEDLAQAPSSQTPRGGRHFWFRQPVGKHWRCTQGRLAEKVDTRANGGYIVAPPSSVNGRAYRWLESHGLDVTPDRLPEPYVWLVDQLDRIALMLERTSSAAHRNGGILEGRRNGVLTSSAGSMRRVGLSQAEIAAALHRMNVDRCIPPLPAIEVDRIAASIARYAPDDVAAAVAQDRLGEMAENPIAQPSSVRRLVSNYPALRDPVIHGLLRRGETMNIISFPKLGKSWLVLALALAVATGRTWLGMFKTEPGDVLILDNELHGETSAQRIPMVAEASGIPFDAIADRLFVLNLRGQLMDVFSLRPFFECVEPGRFKVIILDAFYRFMPRDMDENDNGTMANLYNHLDAYADRVGCGFVLIHHTTKGNQSAKSVTDVGAGAGSQSRATDTHLVLRPHEQPGAVVLEAAVRSWPPVLPLCLRWSYPVWTPAPDLDPAALQAAKPARRKERTKSDKSDSPQARSWNEERFVEAFISEKPTTKAVIREAAKDQPGLSLRRVSDLIDIAESQGRIHRWTVGRAHRVLYATVAQSIAEETDS